MPAPGSLEACSKARASLTYLSQSVSVQPYSSRETRPCVTISSIIAASPKPRSPWSSSSVRPSSLCSAREASIGLPKRIFVATNLCSEYARPPASTSSWAASSSDTLRERLSGFGDGTCSARTWWSISCSSHFSQRSGRDIASSAAHLVGHSLRSAEAMQPGHASWHKSGRPGKSSITSAASLRTCSATAHISARCALGPRSSIMSSWSTLEESPLVFGRVVLSSMSSCVWWRPTRWVCMTAPRFQKRWYLPKP